ncbi:hypothetical protein FACS1894180_9150 [Bacteroidia bacterium]|nr:hypothetical protein FACS1894180_9150 [Bacteroidia bacterium]
MKKLLFAFFYLTTLPAVAQNYCMTAPQGYGAAATGGAGGVLVTVNTVAALKTELLSEGAKTIIVAENLTFDINNMINGIVADKTLLGMRGVRLVQNDDKGILELKKGSNNVIIRNLIFEGTGAFDMNGNEEIIFF